MIDNMFGVAMVPFIMAVVAVIKKQDIVNKKRLPLIAWGTGIALGFAYGLTQGGWPILQCLIVGSALGLSASGLYETTLQKRE